MLTLHEPALRRAYQQAVLVAWPDVTEVRSGRPSLPTTASDLPVAYAVCGTITFDPGGGAAAAKETHHVYPFTIALIDQIPENADLEDLRTQRAQALLDQITAAPRFAGWPRTVRSVQLAEDAFSGSDGESIRYYLLTLSIESETLSDA